MRKQTYEGDAYLDGELILNSFFEAYNFKQAVSIFTRKIKETCQEENFDESKVKKWINCH